MFNDHENKKKNRQKLRIREYSNGDKYLEIKTKPAENFTKKITIFNNSLSYWCIIKANISIILLSIIIAKHIIYTSMIRKQCDKM